MPTLTVYRITGRQIGPLSVAHRFCEECDLTVSVARTVAEELGRDVEVEVKPWLRHAFEALRRGGWHAPVVTIDGRLFSQGTVPHPEALKAALVTAAARTAEDRPVASEAG